MTTFSVLLLLSCTLPLASDDTARVAPIAWWSFDSVQDGHVFDNARQTRPSHTSLSQIKWKPYAEGRRSRTWIMMQGMSNLEAAQLVPLAASWLHPAELKVVRGEFASSGYNPAQRAYILDNRSSGRASRLQLQIAASNKSPGVNPAFVIRNWGTASARLVLDGLPVEPGPDFRIGHVCTLEGSDLVCWIRVRSTRPTRFLPLPR